MHEENNFCNVVLFAIYALALSFIPCVFITLKVFKIEFSNQTYSTGIIIFSNLSVEGIINPHCPTLKQKLFHFEFH